MDKHKHVMTAISKNITEEKKNHLNICMTETVATLHLVPLLLFILPL